MSKKPVKNLKIIVDVDMEGISGIDDPSQIWGDQKGFEKSRSLMTKEVNAVVRGLKAGGATEVRVVDDHMSGGPSPLNIIPEKLEKSAKLYQGPDFWGRLNEALDGSLAAAVLLGYHAMADDKEGFLTHTIHPFNIARIEINGKVVGETALAALKLAEHGIPVIMVTGDQALIREASELLPGIETVQVKTSLNRRTTKCLDSAEARKRIEEAAKRAVSKIDQLKPLGIQPPYKVRISFPTKEHAEIAAIIPEARRSGETAVSYIGRNVDEAEAFINTEIALTTSILLRKFIRELAKLESFSRIEEKFWEKTRADWLFQ
ncbi:MAG TPA: M55 family metallopeptidase [Candidatus Bathyarchaeia archaeon]|nr:M55 family metallopeptidase [Candidatus Bathyarchaeia archaeon]